MATPTNPLAGLTVQQIADLAASKWATAWQIQSAAWQVWVNVNTTQTPVPPVTQNTQSNAPTPPPSQLPPATNNVAPVSQSGIAALDNFSKDSVEYQKMLAQGFSDEQIMSAFQSVKNKAIGWQQQTPPAQQQQQQTQTQQPAQKQWAEPSYSDNSEARLVEISQNLNNFLQTSPDMFTTEDIFRANFKYNERSADQKRVLDAFYDRYQQWQIATEASSLWSMLSNQEIIDGYTTGAISDIKLQELQKLDPIKYAAIKKEIDKAAMYSDANDTLTWIKKTLADLWLTEQTAVPQLQAEYDRLLGTEELTQMGTDLEAKKGEIEQIDEQIFNMKDEIEAQYAWTGITRGVLNAIIADRTEALNKQKRTASIDYNTSLNQYNVLREDAMNRFSLIEKQYVMEQNARQAKMQELGFAMDFMRFETPEQADERERQKMLRMETFKTWDINSTDPVIRNKAISNAVDTVLAEFAWIPIQRSREQIIADVTRLVDSGVDLGTAITNDLRKPIMNKPEYKSFVQSKFWQDNKPFMLGDNAYIREENGNYVPFNPTAWLNLIAPVWLWDLSNTELVSKYPNEASFKNNNPTWIKVSINQNTKNLLEANWISYTEGTKSPEGWNYMKFATMEEWIKAYEVLLTKASHDDIHKRLKQRVWTANWDNYANSIMKEAWIPQGTKFSQLSPDQLNSLMNSQLKRESRWLYSYLQTQWTQGGWWVAETILASGKFTKAQEKTIREAISSWQDALTVVKNQAKNIMGSAEATNTTKIERAKSSFENAVSLLDQYYAAWGKTSLFKGNLENTINRLWEVKDPKLVTIATAIQTSLQAYRNAISGTAYSEQEWRDIASIFPWINKSQWLNRAIINWRISQFENDIDTAYEIAIWPAYYDIKNSSTKTFQSTDIKWDIINYLNSLSWVPVYTPGTNIDLSTFPW
jgi:hypothetical protein